MILKIKKRLTTFDKCVLFINCISTSVLLLSYLAPVTDPRNLWIIAILGLMYPLLLILNIIFLIYWLIRAKLYVLISAMCILIGIKILMMNLRFNKLNTFDKKTIPASIRMMAYNVQGFGKFGKTNNNKLIQKEILQLISDKQPDIINLEEIYLDIFNRDTVYSSLKKTLRGGYHYFKSYNSTRWDSSGIAIFSKFPIIAQGSIYSPADHVETQVIYADIKNGNNIFRVYCLHLQSTQFDDEEHQYLKDVAKYGEVNLHESKIISGKLKSAFIKRSLQAALIKHHMAGCPYPFIVAGDFNDTPISFTVNQVSKGLKNAFIEKGNGFGITYYGDFPHSQIDYILLSPQFNVINYRVIDQKLSDHYPIISDLLLTNGLHL